jgi:hypothetical protein
MVGSIAIQGTTEWILAGAPETILAERMRELMVWEREEESRFSYQGGALTNLNMLPKLICNFFIISRDYRMVEVSYFSNSSFTELPQEIGSIVDTKEFAQIFDEKSFQFPWCEKILGMSGM